MWILFLLTMALPDHIFSITTPDKTDERKLPDKGMQNTIIQFNNKVEIILTLNKTSNWNKITTAIYSYYNSPPY